MTIQGSLLLIKLMLLLHINIFFAYTIQTPTYVSFFSMGQREFVCNAPILWILRSHFLMMNYLINLGKQQQKNKTICYPMNMT